jgi:hypothetical protein
MSRTKVRELEKQIFKYTKIQLYKDTVIQRYSFTEIQLYRDTVVQRYKYMDKLVILNHVPNEGEGA